MSCENLCFFFQIGPVGPRGYPGPQGSPGYCEMCNNVYYAGRPSVAGNFKGPWIVVIYINILIKYLY